MLNRSKLAQPSEDPTRVPSHKLSLRGNAASALTSADADGGLSTCPPPLSLEQDTIKSTSGHVVSSRGPSDLFSSSFFLALPLPPFLSYFPPRRSVFLRRERQGDCVDDAAKARTKEKPVLLSDEGSEVTRSIEPSLTCLALMMAAPLPPPRPLDTHWAPTFWVAPSPSPSPPPPSHLHLLTPPLHCGTLYPPPFLPSRPRAA